MTPKRRRNDGLARRAKDSLAQLPEGGERRFPALSGKAQHGVPVVGPGWYGMVPVLYTQQRNLIVFLPLDLFSTLAQSEDVTMRAVAGQGDAELVAKLYREG